MTDAEKLDIAINVLRAIHNEFRATVREMDRQPGGGMSVPFCGDFPPASLSPGAKGRFRWWEQVVRRAFREMEVSLDGE